MVAQSGCQKGHVSAQKSRQSLYKNVKTECRNGNMSHKRAVHDSVSTSSTTTWRRRRNVLDVSSLKKDNTSRNDYWQNDSLFAEIVDLFILLTPLHSTTFKTEVSTWYIAACAREHDSLTTWLDVRAWTIGIVCPSDALRDIDMWWEHWMTLCLIPCGMVVTLGGRWICIDVYGFAIVGT